VLIPPLEEGRFVLDREMAKPAQLRRVETTGVFDPNRFEPDLGRCVAFGHVDVRRLDPVPGVEGEAEALDPE
jgi:hypothetical protein